MIIQALYRYYQILLEDPDVEIAVPAYSSTRVSFALDLTRDGELLDVIPLFIPVQRGNRVVEEPRRVIVPEQVKRSGVNPSPNFMCDSATFVLGISEKDDSDPEYSRKRFEGFREYNLRLLSQAASETSRAVMAFLRNHIPQESRQHPAIKRHLDELLKGGNLIFRVGGIDALEDLEIRRVWEESKSETDSIKMQCLVTGEIEPIARLHPNIQGVRNANPTGASLVGFNDRAYESYNREGQQGINSPVSQRVASGYGVALNYLLSSQNPNRKIIIGDTTVVYWAESTNKQYANTFSALINPEYLDTETSFENNEQKAANERIGHLAKKIEKAQPMDITHLNDSLDPSTRFYVLGLAPNAARLAVRFFLTEPFGKFVERIMVHYRDLSIIKESPNQPDYISVSRILRECVSPKVTRREEELASSWALLGGSLMRAILNGAPYPEELYYAILNRIRTDSDTANSHKINYTRVAVIKAHLIRKYRRQDRNPFQEVLQMSLNEEYTQPAYVLGRLFAVLESVQREALGGNVDATIKDRYFASACATPASVFPVLLRLSQHHIAKAEHGKQSDNRIQNLLNLLDVEKNAFPAHLSLDEQGVFVLGYYHQRAAFFMRNNAQTTEKPAPVQ